MAIRHIAKIAGAAALVLALSGCGGGGGGGGFVPVPQPFPFIPGPTPFPTGGSNVPGGFAFVLNRADNGGLGDITEMGVDSGNGTPVALQTFSVASGANVKGAGGTPTVAPIVGLTESSDGTTLYVAVGASGGVNTVTGLASQAGVVIVSVNQTTGAVTQQTRDAVVTQDGLAPTGAMVEDPSQTSLFVAAAGGANTATVEAFRVAANSLTPEPTTFPSAFGVSITTLACTSVGASEVLAAGGTFVQAGANANGVFGFVVNPATAGLTIGASGVGTAGVPQALTLEPSSGTTTTGAVGSNVDNLIVFPIDSTGTINPAQASTNPFNPNNDAQLPTVTSLTSVTFVGGSQFLVVTTNDAVNNVASFPVTGPATLSTGEETSTVTQAGTLGSALLIPLQGAIPALLVTNNTGGNNVTAFTFDGSGNLLQNPTPGQAGFNPSQITAGP